LLQGFIFSSDHEQFGSTKFEMDDYLCTVWE
jgi:hypothetical protein